MANIAENLAKILSSRYGKDVRQAIHDAIFDINEIAEGQEQTIEGHIADAEAWAKGTKDGTPVESTDPQYHNNAKYFSDEAASSATAASNSASAAAGSATTADNKSKDSEAWAVGKRGGTDVPSTDPTYENNAKYWQAMANYWYLQAKAIAEGLAGALIPMGTVTFANLPSLASAEDGWMYNISDSFTTTSDFKEGSGHVIPAGSNVYKTGDGKWDILAGSPVSGVKGSAEANYRTGNVSITPANIGLGNVRNVDVGDPSTLDTTNKQIVGAINEIDSDLSKNKKGTVTNFRDYTAANPFVIPTDGYIRVLTGSINNSSFVDVYVMGSDDLFITNVSVQGNGTNPMANSLFVRKGMKVFPNKNDNYEPIHFVPLT